MKLLSFITDIIVCLLSIATMIFLIVNNHIAASLGWACASMHVLRIIAYRLSGDIK